MACASATEARGGEAAIGPSLEIGNQRPPRAVAARAVDVQLKAVAADVAYRLDRKLAEHGADRTAAACTESLCQQ